MFGKIKYGQYLEEAGMRNCEEWTLCGSPQHTTTLSVRNKSLLNPILGSRDSRCHSNTLTVQSDSRRHLHMRRPFHCWIFQQLAVTFLMGKSDLMWPSHLHWTRQMHCWISWKWVLWNLRRICFWVDIGWVHLHHLSNKGKYVLGIK